jgi:hypothetical protein
VVPVDRALRFAMTVFSRRRRTGGKPTSVTAAAAGDRGKDDSICRADGRSVRTFDRPLSREFAMGDKSPHDAHHSQKSAKSIKEKRAERKAKDERTPSPMAPSAMARLTADHRRGS